MAKPRLEILDSDGNVMLDMATFANAAIGIANIPQIAITESYTNSVADKITFRTKIDLFSPIDFNCLPVAMFSSRLDSEWTVANPWFVVQSITNSGRQFPSIGAVVANGNSLYLICSVTRNMNGNSTGIKVLVGLGN